MASIFLVASSSHSFLSILCPSSSSICAFSLQRRSLPDLHTITFWKITINNIGGHEQYLWLVVTLAQENQLCDESERTKRTLNRANGQCGDKANPKQNNFVTNKNTYFEIIKSSDDVLNRFTLVHHAWCGLCWRQRTATDIRVQCEDITLFISH